MIRPALPPLVLCLAVTGCAAPASEVPTPEASAAVESLETRMSPLAERYVKLVLALGIQDEGYVDAYYGPQPWRSEVEAESPSLAAIEERARTLYGELEALAPEVAALAGEEGEMLRRRHRYLTTQLASLRARVEILQGRVLDFDQESRALFDATAPRLSEEDFRPVLEHLDGLLPGEGPVPARFAAFRDRFVIPPDRLDGVFQAAIQACRERTLDHLELPQGESFTVEYVTDKPWSGYNWYQGDFRSLIQVNTDLPIHIDRAIDLACHEGYPGHHTYNALLEKHLVRDRGWLEYSVYALFSPQSLIAEGTANFGIRMAFPGEERIAFEEEALFPAAGLDPSQAGRYYEVLEAARSLSYAGNEAARGYLDGALTAEEAADHLHRFALMSPERAAQRVRFIDAYRSYVINYNYGRDLVRRYVEERAETPQERWAVFAELLSSPLLPSDLE